MTLYERWKSAEGQRAIYGEAGHDVTVRILKVSRKSYGATNGTAIKFEALEANQLIPKGSTWESWASDDAGGYAGWDLSVTSRQEKATT